MSIPAGSRISICDREFSHYSDLAKHMKFILAEHIKGSSIMTKKHLIKSLKAFKKTLVFGKHSDAYEYLLKENFHKVCIDLMKICNDNDDGTLLTALLSCIITITDNSKDMREVLVNDGLPTLLMYQTIRISNKEFKIQLAKSISCDDLMAQLILIIDNIVCDARFQQSFLQDEYISKFKESIYPYMQSKDERMCIMTMTALTYLIEEEGDRCRLDFYSKIIENFIEYIKRGLNDKERRCNGLRINELLAVIQCLSNIDSIKSTMIRMKSLICLIQKILESKSSNDDEIQISLGILYNLSFRNDSEDSKKIGTLKDVCQIDILVQPFQKCEVAPIKRYADGLISELTEKLEKRKYDIKYDVFISYTNNDRKRILNIANMLQKKNFKIRIDDGNDKRFEYEDVEQSIQQSKLLLIGVSNSYYNDQCCHSECDLAYRLKKPILPILMEHKYSAKAWLKKMIHKNILIDFSNESEFENAIEKVIKHVNVVLKEDILSEKETSEISEKVETVTLKQSYKEEKEVKLWNKDQVSEWLRSNKLANIQSNLAKYDGKMLEYLRKMKNSAPEQYSRRLKEDLNLAFEDEINFDEALDNLIG